MSIHSKTLGLFLAAFVLTATPASADFVGFNAFFDPIIPIGDPIVTPPLSNSDNLSYPISMAFYPGPQSNWAGVGFTLLYDPAETDFFGLTPRASFILTNTPSPAPISLPTLWHVAASASGITASGSFKIADVALHVIGTTTANNGDTDVRATLPSFAFNIFHVSEAGPLALAPGDFVYLNPGQPVSGSQRGVGAVAGPALTALPPVPVGAGVWVKLNNAETPNAATSAFWGSAINPVGVIKIEHAGGLPAVPTLTFWGLAALLMGIALTAIYTLRQRSADR